MGMSQAELLSLFDTATETGFRIIRSVPERIWGVQPEKKFGPGEIIVHLTQSEGFALKFIVPAVTEWFMKPFVLTEPFVSLVAIPDPKLRHQKLSELNLQGARQGILKFKELDELRNFWVTRRQEARAMLDRIPETQYRETIDYPLVHLSETCAKMIVILFVHHCYYHLGQLTAQMKELGYADCVPFPFGEFV